MKNLRAGALVLCMLVSCGPSSEGGNTGTPEGGTGGSGQTGGMNRDAGGPGMGGMGGTAREAGTPGGGGNGNDSGTPDGVDKDGGTQGMGGHKDGGTQGMGGGHKDGSASGAGGIGKDGGQVGTGGANGTGGAAALDSGAAGNAEAGGGVKLAWGGVRSSTYGITEAGFSTFPTADKWASAMKTMAGYFEGATPSATIWLVGEVDYDNKGMILEFPKPNDGKSYSSLYQFASKDQHESHLAHFDTQGVQVYLEIEPGDADIPTLIDLVLSRYKGHQSVIGLAIDAEWIGKTSDNGQDIPITDTQAKSWEEQVKSYSSSYRLVLKHFDEENLPPTYRGDILFANDDEQNGDYASFKKELKKFADFFYPSDVMFQVGYPSDRGWWSKLASPIPQTIGKDLEKQTKQRFGVLWVDFTINDAAVRLIP